MQPIVLARHPKSWSHCGHDSYSITTDCRILVKHNELWPPSSSSLSFGSIVALVFVFILTQLDCVIVTRPLSLCRPFFVRSFVFVRLALFELRFGSLFRFGRSFQSFASLSIATIFNRTTDSANHSECPPQPSCDVDDSVLVSAWRAQSDQVQQSTAGPNPSRPFWSAVARLSLFVFCARVLLALRPEFFLSLNIRSYEIVKKLAKHLIRLHINAQSSLHSFRFSFFRASVCSGLTWSAVFTQAAAFAIHCFELTCSSSSLFEIRLLVICFPRWQQHLATVQVYLCSFLIRVHLSSPLPTPLSFSSCFSFWCLRHHVLCRLLEQFLFAALSFSINESIVISYISKPSETVGFLLPVTPSRHLHKAPSLRTICGCAIAPYSLFRVSCHHWPVIA